MTNSRNKGAAGEREFANVIQNELGVSLIRNLEQSRSGGHDLIIQGECSISARLNRFAIEVKRYRQATDGLISEWWQQTIEQAERANKTPLLAFRGDRQQWRIVIPLREVSNHLPDKYPDIPFTGWLSVQAFGVMIRELDKAACKSKLTDNDNDNGLQALPFTGLVPR